MGKGTGSVSVIGGADGPTSIFIAGKGGKVKLTTRIRNYFGKGVAFTVCRTSLGTKIRRILRWQSIK